MRKPWLAGVSGFTALALLAAVCGAAWAAGGGGGGGHGGGGGGGFSGGGGRGGAGGGSFSSGSRGGAGAGSFSSGSRGGAGAGSFSSGSGRGGPGTGSFSSGSGRSGYSGSMGGSSGSHGMDHSGTRSPGAAGWQGHAGPSGSLGPNRGSPGSLGPNRGSPGPQGSRDHGPPNGFSNRGPHGPSGHGTTLMDKNGLGDRMLGHDHGAHHDGPQAHRDWDHHFPDHHWHHDWDHFNHRFAYYPYPFFFWPFWDYPWYWSFARPYAYNYLYCYDMSPYDVSWYADPVGAPVRTSLTAEQPAPPETAATADDTGLNALEFYSAARDDFKKGDYRKALRLAGHAVVESPENAKVHELSSLALMALGDYRGAAIEAHAVLAFGKASDWNSLFAYYGDADTYTKQLRKLEEHVKAHASSAEGHFLLGFQYMMIGAKDDAKTHMAEAAKLTPKDKLAAQLLEQLGGRPVTPPPPKPAGAK
jgi:hypothetical protein